MFREELKLSSLLQCRRIDWSKEWLGTELENPRNIEGLVRERRNGDFKTYRPYENEDRNGWERNN